MLDTLTVTCHDNGTYDINPLDYTCTNPCQPPTNPDPARIEHDWTEIDTNLEINEEVRYRCKDFDGRPRQLVRKVFIYYVINSGLKIDTSMAKINVVILKKFLHFTFHFRLH